MENHWTEVEATILEMKVCVYVTVLQYTQITVLLIEHNFPVLISTPDHLLICLLLDFEFSEGDSASGYDATGSSIPMRTTYTTGGKTNPPSCSRVFSPQTLSVLIQFLSFIQLELRIQPSYETWTPWHRCRSLRGLRMESLTAARFPLHSEPR